MTVHYTHPYLLNPQHKITVNLIGLGGTGSQVLGCLARLHMALTGIGHPGIHVRAWDPDKVSPANIGRQLFFQPDIGQNKAIVLISRVNRSFGFEWEAFPSEYTKRSANIHITCIDTAQGRIEIGEMLSDSQTGEPHKRNIYWLDIGNLQKTGQVILGTAPGISVTQPKSDHTTTTSLPNVVKFFPALSKIKEKDQGPSCSLAQALNRQDLFINSTLAQYGVNLIWKLFREGMIRYHGCYVNLDLFTVNPIRIQSKIKNLNKSKK